MAAPVMYNAAPAPNADRAKEEIWMQNMTSSPTDTLLTSPAQVFKLPLLLSVNDQILKFCVFSRISLFGQTTFSFFPGISL